MRRRRKRKKNPDAGTVLAGIGGALVVPIPANAIGVVAAVNGSPRVGLLAHAGVAALSTWGALRSRSPATQWALAGGAASSALNALAWLAIASWRPVEPAMLHATYQGQPAPAAPPLLPPGGSRQWQAFNPEAPMVPLMTGVRYRAAIDLPFGVGALATEERVKAKAREMGFSDADILIADGNPDVLGWRDPFGRIDDGDLFVEATYVGEPKWLERNERMVSAWAFT